MSLVGVYFTGSSFGDEFVVCGCIDPICVISLLGTNLAGSRFGYEFVIGDCIDPICVISLLGTNLAVSNNLGAEFGDVCGCFGKSIP